MIAPKTGQGRIDMKFLTRSTSKRLKRVPHVQGRPEGPPALVSWSSRLAVFRLLVLYAVNRLG
jgi:hypothetical protein